MDSEKATNSGPKLCANGCGFFGSGETQNLCSKCYNDFLKEKLIKINTTKIASFSLNDNEKPTTATATASTAKISSSFLNALSFRKMKNRCESCNKKVGILGFNCRCGGLFCGVHRYAEEHFCTFDFKSFVRQVLAKNNPLCDVDKLSERV